MRTRSVAAFWRYGLVLLGFVLFAASCVFPGEAPRSSTPQPLIVKISRAQLTRAYQWPDDYDWPDFELRLSERDAETLGASKTRYLKDQSEISIFVDTKFFSFSDRGAEDGPCLADEVVVANLDTGQLFTVFPAGHCIERGWAVSVEGAFAYLEGGP